MPAATKEQTAQLRRDILDMRLTGWSTIEIAQELDLTVHTIGEHLRKARTDIDATRYLEGEVSNSLDRLELMFRIVWPMASGRRRGTPVAQAEPDREWMRVLLQIEESKRKLLGLDAPKKVDVRVGVRQWAEDNGLDPDDVEMVAPALLAQFAGR
jgi:hypothetical protein